MDINQLVSIPEAAKMLKMNANVLNYYSKNGDIPNAQLIGGRRYYFIDEIKKWQKPNRKKGRKKAKVD